MWNEEETMPRAGRASVRMWPGITAGVVIGLIAFVLSFDALRLVFVACGINPWLSWGGPVCVDGTILLCTWATWGFRKGRIRGGAYPWVGLIAFSLFSIAGNALHAVLNTGYDLPAWVAPAVMSIPPVALLYSTHLIVIIAGDRLDKIDTDDGERRVLSDAAASGPVREPRPERPHDEPTTASPTMPDIRPMPPVPTVGTTPEPAVATEPEGTEEAWAPSDAERTIAGIPDLGDWMVPVPRMEDDASPKAFEAEADAADASEPDTTDEPEPAGPATHDEGAARDDGDGTAERPGTTDGTDDDGTPRDAVPDTPEPSMDGDVPHAAAEADATPRRGRGRSALGDEAWLAWLDALAGGDAAPTAARAVDAGLAASTSTAKRHLARLRRDHPERFGPWKA